LIDKPQFAIATENSTAFGKIAPQCAVPSPALVGNDSINEERTNDPRSNPTLDQESLAALCKFFELLVEWDHKEEQP